MFRDKFASAALFLATVIAWYSHCAVAANNGSGPLYYQQQGGQKIPLIPAASKKIYYEPTIKKIIRADCGRCHSGATRNLMDYDNLKAYASSGMLSAMVQGSMGRFAVGDIQRIVTWVNNGAPEKPQTTQASYQQGGVSHTPLIAAASKKVYYEPTIKKIILADCGRCHLGAVRNLTDYDSLKAYASSGMLSAMVQGSMGRFAGGDTQTIVTWVTNGAPEKSPGIQANLIPGPCPGTPRYQPGVQLPNTPNDQTTYNNTIKCILAGDCLRCHSGQFRNLTTYENVKMYADNGLLKQLVKMGGPMHRFAGPDSRLIIAWVNNGAPK
jgi:mono/diheme cytochrome c family protein